MDLQANEITKTQKVTNMTTATMTITLPVDAGEVAIFKIKPLVEINEVVEWVEVASTEECLINGQAMGLWQIV